MKMKISKKVYEERSVDYYDYKFTEDGDLLVINLADNYENPRRDDDFVLFHLFTNMRNTDFSDRGESEETFIYEVLAEADKRGIELNENQSDWNKPDFFDRTDIRHVVKLAKELDFVVQPIYIYSHSGLAISLSPFNDQFDSGVAGFMYASKAEIYEKYGKKISDEKIDELLKNEFSILKNYIEGDVYEIEQYNHEEIVVEDGEVTIMDDADCEYHGPFYGEDDLNSYIEGTYVLQKQEDEPRASM